MNIKKITAASAAAVLIFGAAASASACTGIYVGKDASADGSIIIARTEDMVSDESKRLIVHPAADHEAGEYYTDAFGLRVELPAHTYRYTAVPGSEERGIGEAPYGEAGFNELGVAATATITGYPNDTAIAADPYTESGLHEISAADIILSQASSAREGIEIIAKIVDEQGAKEGSIIMTADKTEAWYMEIYTGHQYAATRLPDDRAAIIPNAFMLGVVDISSEDVIASTDIENLPRENGFLETKNDLINLRETYSEEAKDSNSIRIWGGSRLLHRAMWTDPYKSDYDLLFRPSQKITVKEIMNTFRTRYEGTKYSLDDPSNKYVRAIATARQEECHILQIRPDMDTEVGCIEWLTLGSCEFVPFVPYYAAAITDVPSMMSLDAAEYDEYSAFWNSKALSVLCGMNRTLYGSKVKAFFGEYEDALIKSIAETDDEMEAAVNKTQTANKLCYDYAYDSFNKQRDMYKLVMGFLARCEGEAEDKDNTCTFEITSLTPALDDFPAHATSLAPVITLD